MKESYCHITHKTQQHSLHQSLYLRKTSPLYALKNPQTHTLVSVCHYFKGLFSALQEKKESIVKVPIDVYKSNTELHALHNPMKK